MCFYNSMAENRPAHGQFSISKIDPNLCTHLVYAFADIKENEIVPANLGDIGKYIDFNALKERSVQKYKKSQFCMFYTINEWRS